MTVQSLNPGICFAFEMMGNPLLTLCAPAGCERWSFYHPVRPIAPRAHLRCTPREVVPRESRWRSLEVSNFLWRPAILPVSVAPPAVAHLLSSGFVLERKSQDDAVNLHLFCYFRYLFIRKSGSELGNFFFEKIFSYQMIYSGRVLCLHKTAIFFFFFSFLRGTKSF